MPPLLVADEFVDVQLPALAGIKRPNALVDLDTQPAQLLDMRQKLTADRFLVGYREVVTSATASLRTLDISDMRAT
ncbi:MAG: hypothetical protein K2Y71_22450 [Xanthobacteraceae bacterium]|nr:hypothetical protein [Xanthobacteraceae bacterium]